MTDRLTIDETMLNSFGYHPVRLLPSGEWAGVMDMLFTAALMVGMDDIGYRTRFCYEHRRDAETALTEWDGAGDPPGPWLKEKSSNRLGPGLLNDEYA